MNALGRVAHCLAAAAQDGYRVGIVDGRVRVRRIAVEGREVPSCGEAWRAELRALDPAVVAMVLALDVATAVEGFDRDTLEAFEERAAIAEHDAGLARELAERVAWCWISEDAR